MMEILRKILMNLWKYSYIFGLSTLVLTLLAYFLFNPNRANRILNEIIKTDNFPSNYEYILRKICTSTWGIRTLEGPIGSAKKQQVNLEVLGPSTGTG